jgi:hypothetical protein
MRMMACMPNCDYATAGSYIDFAALPLVEWVRQKNVPESPTLRPAIGKRFSGAFQPPPDGHKTPAPTASSLQCPFIYPSFLKPSLI